MSFRRRRVSYQTCSLTGNPKRRWRSQWPNGTPVHGGVAVDEPVSYNAAPGPKQRPKLKRHPVTPEALDLLSAMHAVRLGIPLSARGHAILQMFLRSQ